MKVAHHCAVFVQTRSCGQNTLLTSIGQIFLVLWKAHPAQQCVPNLSEKIHCLLLSLAQNISKPASIVQPRIGLLKPHTTQSNRLGTKKLLRMHLSQCQEGISVVMTQEVVVSTGNPRVEIHRPAPVPVQNPYPHNGYGFSSGSGLSDPYPCPHPYPSVRVHGFGVLTRRRERRAHVK